MSLLKDLKAEVASTKEPMQQPSYLPREHPDPALPPDCTPHQLTPLHHGPPQRQWCASTPAAQYGYLQPSQRFAKQHPLPTLRRRRRCYSCKQENVEDCIYCFRCGSNEHFAVGCRMGTSGRARLSALNSQGFPLEGQGLTTLSAAPQLCFHSVHSVRLRQCASCKGVLYCSKACQYEHWVIQKHQCLTTWYRQRDRILY